MERFELSFEYWELQCLIPSLAIKELCWRAKSAKYYTDRAVKHGNRIVFGEAAKPGIEPIHKQGHYQAG